MTNHTTLLSEALKAIESTEQLADLDSLRVHYLGKQGVLTQSLKTIGALPPEERKLAGAALNEIKTQITDSIAARKEILTALSLEQALAQARIDVTLPGRNGFQGALHPVTRAMERMVHIFEQFGFTPVSGPEIEDDFHNFEALNTPADHPARAGHDTFYFTENHLLRSHTSPVQIRTLRASEPPVRVISTGRVYRRDSDLTHVPMFHQVEGLCVDKTANFAELKALLHEFVNRFFEKSLKIRFRPCYFPFTEPSAELDVSCVKCEGAGCRICKQTGWLEVLGAGMVHPNVLKACGVDSTQYQGFAWGMGVERFAMLRYGMDDLRALYENDMRFLSGAWSQNHEV